MPLSASDWRLINSAYYGNLQDVRDMLRAGANVNALRPQDGKTALYVASQNGHSEVVRELLQNNKVDVNLQLTTGATALYAASYKGHVEVVRELLQNNEVNVNHFCTDGETALYMASQEGHVDVVRELLQHNMIDVNLPSTEGATPLFIASENGRVEVVRELLQNNMVGVNLQRNSGATALFMASQNGHLEVVRELLQNNNVDVNLQLYNGATALFVATYLGHVEVVRELLQNNEVDVNLQHTTGATALFVASHNGLVEIVRMLLRNNTVDVNLQLTTGATALYAASHEGHVDVVRLLLQNNELDVNLHCLDGSTALDIALKEKKDDVARLLIEYMEKERNRLEEEEPKRREEDERKHQTDEELQQGMVKKHHRQEMINRNATSSGAVDRVTDDPPLRNENSPSGDDAKIAQDGSKLLHVMNTSSADPVELSVEYIERCLTDHKLGSGAYGDVFLAEDSRLPKIFAVKMIRTSTRCNETDIKEMRRSFQRELSTLKRFRHPNIIVLYGYSLSANCTQQCLVYEYAAKGSLAGFFTENGKRDQLSSDIRLSIMFELTRAVHFLHTGGCKVAGKGWKVFHRDIKSSNICLADDFTPRLIDCGLAKFVPDVNSSSAPGPLTVSLRNNTDGLAFGTPGYMCPEYIRKKFNGHPCPYIAAYDVYSIGVVLVELILGRLYGAQSTRNDSQFLDVFEMYVQGGRTHQRIVDGWEKLKRDADPTIMWNPDALELACKAAIECMDPFPDKRMSTKDLLDKLREAINLNTNAGNLHPDETSAVDSGPYCLICKNYRTDVKCSEGHVLCTFCIVERLGDYIGCQLTCLIKECSSKVQDTDVYGRIPIEMYNRYVKKRVERRI